LVGFALFFGHYPAWDGDCLLSVLMFFGRSRGFFLNAGQAGSRPGGRLTFFCFAKRK
jgi:hypothetical protein